MTILFKLARLTSHNILLIVASLRVSPGNELSFWEEGGALQFHKARLDLLAHLQDACLKTAANLINLIINMVFLMITSQFGLLCLLLFQTTMCFLKEFARNVQDTGVSELILAKTYPIDVLKFLTSSFLDHVTLALFLHTSLKQGQEGM